MGLPPREEPPEEHENPPEDNNPPSRDAPPLGTTGGEPLTFEDMMSGDPQRILTMGRTVDLGDGVSVRRMRPFVSIKTHYTAKEVWDDIIGGVATGLSNPLAFVDESDDLNKAINGDDAGLTKKQRHDVDTAGKVIGIAGSLVSPPLAIASSVANTVNKVSKGERPEVSDIAMLAFLGKGGGEGASSEGASGSAGKKGPSYTTTGGSEGTTTSGSESSGSGSSGSSSGGSEGPRPPPRRSSFRPPTRLSDGRFGYLASPMEGTPVDKIGSIRPNAPEAGPAYAVNPPEPTASGGAGANPPEVTAPGSVTTTPPEGAGPEYAVNPSEPTGATGGAKPKISASEVKQQIKAAEGGKPKINATREQTQPRLGAPGGAVRVGPTGGTEPTGATGGTEPTGATGGTRPKISASEVKQQIEAAEGREPKINATGGAEAEPIFPTEGNPLDPADPAYLGKNGIDLEGQKPADLKYDAASHLIEINVDPRSAPEKGPDIPTLKAHIRSVYETIYKGSETFRKAVAYAIKTKRIAPDSNSTDIKLHWSVLKPKYMRAYHNINSRSSIEIDWDSYKDGSKVVDYHQGARYVTAPGKVGEIGFTRSLAHEMGHVLLDTKDPVNQKLPGSTVAFENQVMKELGSSEPERLAYHFKPQGPFLPDDEALMSNPYEIGRNRKISTKLPDFSKKPPKPLWAVDNKTGKLKPINHDLISRPVSLLTQGISQFADKSQININEHPRAVVGVDTDTNTLGASHGPSYSSNLT